MTRALVVLVLGSAALAQDVSVTLATSGGRTKFRMGEAVEVELRFRASVRGRYLVDTTETTRYGRVRRPDRFSIEPAGGAVDPYGDGPEGSAGGVFSGNVTGPQALGSEVVAVKLQVNCWLSFRQPGRYQLTAETTRVSTWGQNKLPLRSNAVAIEIAAPEAEWQAQQLRRAVAVLERAPLPTPAIGEDFDRRSSRNSTRRPCGRLERPGFSKRLPPHARWRASTRTGRKWHSRT